ncbi:hypothetical protein [Octadecabacter ascidiaceicola]|uniref:Uncharacterized protein n=1 Tax=Octadecabacter ascidiaceicola TaxID=1655543 RepID=A0A238K954_9RHOB|nr:hypothetical protein [Octadecabacter ascidiaceicola]SMX39379.1 hypothetical protein OCA8868_01951 [Octadecabacter ascidiaceicola]
MDNNWKTATKVDRAALYHVARAIADTTNLSVENIMEQAFGHKLMVGTDYLSNFRSGTIGRPKAKLIHAWIAKNHLETAHAVDPRLFPKPHTNAWDDYIEEHGIRGQLQIKRFTKGELNLIKKIKDRDALDATLKLGEEFCFFLRSDVRAHAIGFEQYKGKWHVMPLGPNGSHIFQLRSDEPYFPIDTNGEIERLSEESDLDVHRFAVVVSQDANDLPCTPDIRDIGQTANLHYIDVLFSA